jgi:hypothetical protein
VPAEAAAAEVPVPSAVESAAPVDEPVAAVAQPQPDPADEIQAYQEAIRRSPRHAPYYRALGLAHAAAGNRTAAIRYLRGYLKAARRPPDRAAIVARIRRLSRK